MYKKIFGNPRFMLIASCVGCVLVGIVAGYILRMKPWIPRTNEAPGKQIRLSDSRYPHIAPLLACDYQGKKKYSEYASLNNDLQKLINARVALGKADTVSVYFRDLTNGDWAGVNQYAQYTPASLIKVPLMIALFRQAEADPSLLSMKLTVESKDDGGQVQEIPPTRTVEVGKTYTVDELVSYMIVDSDNDATRILMKLINKKAFDDVMTDLGIDPPQGNGNDYEISPKSFSLFFRVLYNATVLSPEMSEKAMVLLNQSDFNDGLRASIPAEIPLAHKFGEAGVRDLAGSLTGREIHDCGIAVVPKHPYAICVMSKGKDIKALEGVIKDVSDLVYQKVLTVKR